MRLNKYLASCGVGSRRKVEELIVEGRVEVNNKTVVDLATQINEESDHVKVDGQKLAIRKHVYYLLNKPKGVITTTADERDRKTVVDLIDTKDIIFPVGRLDFNTTGVLFLTNDGEFSNLVTHPKNKIPREYEVLLDRPLDDKDKEKLLKIKGRSGENFELVIDRVRPILKDVRLKGDSAVSFYSKKFDNFELTKNNIQIKNEEIEYAYKKLIEDRI